MIRNYQCTKCNTIWQKDGSLELYNKFSFKKTVGQPDLTVCKKCRYKPLRRHSRVQGIKDAQSRTGTTSAGK